MLLALPYGRSKPGNNTRTEVPDAPRGCIAGGTRYDDSCASGSAGLNPHHRSGETARLLEAASVRTGGEGADAHGSDEADHGGVRQERVLLVFQGLKT